MKVRSGEDGDAGDGEENEVEEGIDHGQTSVGGREKTAQKTGARREGTVYEERTERRGEGRGGDGAGLFARFRRGMERGEALEEKALKGRFSTPSCTRLETSSHEEGGMR